jgi:hypothetical protein
MSVQFATVVFNNNNSVDVSLTVEAPIGNRVIGPVTVKLNSSRTINPRQNDCASVVLRVTSDADPDEETQTFEVVAPLYLRTLDVNYLIGSFAGSVNAGTE